MKSFVDYVEEKESSASDFLMLDKAVLIGVKHGKQVKVMDLVVETAKRVSGDRVWHEGSKVEDVVSDFCHKHFPGKKHFSWEPSRSLVNESLRLPGIALSLFGCELKQLRENITSHKRYDPQETIMSNLLRTQDNWYGWFQRDKPVRTDELSNIFNQAETDRRAKFIMKSSKNFGKMARESTIGKLKTWHNIGYKIMWVEEKEYPIGWTAFSRLAKRINDARQRKLLSLMRESGGVFFAGDSHVEEVRGLLAE